MTFKTDVAVFNEGLWNIHLKVPDKIFKALTKDGKKRVICQIDDNEEFHGGFMPDGNGGYFIMLSKPKLKKYKLEIGQTVSVTLEKDNTKYGMKMPEEFAEVLASDEEGETFFEALTDGKKRSLIHLVASVKNTDKRISKSLTILDHLKINDGAIDYKLLNQAFKASNNKYQ